jgi:RNA polymerase sigma factor (sigma-70 family)
MRTNAVLTRRGDFVPAVLRLASDQRLAEQVHAGSERAFEALFDRHHEPVLIFCGHMLGSREDAEDVVQLTFLAAYRELVRTEPPVALRPWLYAIARHRCLSALRARRERLVEAVPESATDGLATEIATREDLRAILADVARLPDDQRTALVLSVLADVSYPEIAQILGCPPNKVKALVFQARSSLTAARAARETPCARIREQLATFRGGALLRTTLRRHVHECPDCQAFREQLRTQRRALALLPMAPTVGLKRAVLGAVFGSGGNAGGAALTAGALSGGLAATVLVALTIPAGHITAAVSASQDGTQTASTPARAARTEPPSTLSGRAHAKQAPPEQDRKHPSATVPSAEDAPPREPPAQTEATRRSGFQSERASSDAQFAPGDPPQAAKPFEPPGARRHDPPQAAKPSEPPGARRHDPPQAAKPSEPPGARRHDPPGAPPQAAKPSEPPSARVTSRDSLFSSAS